MRLDCERRRLEWAECRPLPLWTCCAPRRHASQPRFSSLPAFHELGVFPASTSARSAAAAPSAGGVECVSFTLRGRLPVVASGAVAVISVAVVSSNVMVSMFFSNLLRSRQPQGQRPRCGFPRLCCDRPL